MAQDAAPSPPVVVPQSPCIPDPLILLPPDLQWNVLRRLPSPHSTRLACRAVRAPFDAHCIALSLSWPESAKASARTQLLLARLPRLQRLDTCGAMHRNINLAVVPHLTSLAMPSSSITNLLPLATSPSLATLDLSNCHGVINLAPLAALAQLTSLSLRLCTRVDDLAPLSACVALLSLDLWCCHSIVDITPLSSCTRLATLHLGAVVKNGDLRTPLALTALGSMPALTHLDLWRRENVALIRPVAACTALTHLSLSNCCSVADVGCLATLTALRSLDLSYCWRVDRLDPLLFCTALTHLCLVGCPNADVRPLAALVGLHVVTKW